MLQQTNTDFQRRIMLSGLNDLLYYRIRPVTWINFLQLYTIKNIIVKLHNIYSLILSNRTINYSNIFISLMQGLDHASLFDP